MIFRKKSLFILVAILLVHGFAVGAGSPRLAPFGGDQTLMPAHPDLISRSAKSTTRYWDDWIDGLAFWNHFRTTDEISSLQVLPFDAAFVDIGAALDGVSESSVAWGDYDNDGDLDILLTGRIGPNYVISKVYRNDAGTFEEIGAGLDGVSISSVAWGDYDNDGDLDILLSGLSDSGPISKVYRNDVGTFEEIGAGLDGVKFSSVAWGDYDNDGDLDILLTGKIGSNYISKVYSNDAGNFMDTGAALDRVGYGSVAWGDYDNDGDLDILLSGYTGVTGFAYISKVYRNDAGTFVDIGAALDGLFDGEVAWGDYDNDGDLDILLSGFTGYETISKVYRNNAGTFEEIGAGLVGVSSNSIAWGDYDNDGDLDILLTGSIGLNQISKVYRNDAGTFEEIGVGLDEVSNGQVVWGDYDNDGDLDILLTGSTGSDTISKVYRNSILSTNTPPSAPANLSAQLSGSTLTFNWDSATDGETPAAGLSYNLRVGTTPGGSEICSAMSQSTGYRQIAALGNTSQNTSWAIELPPLTAPPYYWSVQAVDTAFEGGPFAAEQIQDSTSGVSESPLPTAFALRNNVPNPFNPVTTIAYDLPRPESVRLQVFDVAGRRVRILLDWRQIPAGRHQMQWDGRDDGGRSVPAGVYLYRIEADSFHETRRMVLVK